MAAAALTAAFVAVGVHSGSEFDPDDWDSAAVTAAIAEWCVAWWWDCGGQADASSCCHGLYGGYIDA